MVIRMTVLVPFRYPTVVLPVPLQIPHLYCSYLYALYKYDIKNLEYRKKEPIIVTLPMTMTADEANEYGNVDFSSAKEDKNYSGKWYFYECLYEITNNATFKMPMTGDDGKWKYGFIGFGVIMVTGIGWIIYNTKTKRIRKHKHKK